MPVSEICNREAVIIKSNDTALEAGRLLRQYPVGDLVMEIMAPVLVTAKENTGVFEAILHMRGEGVRRYYPRWFRREKTGTD